MKKTCGAKTHSGKPCSLPAGHQTVHPGIGRCRFHELTDPTFPFNYQSRKIVKGSGMCRDLSELKAFQRLDRQPMVRKYSIEPVGFPYTLKGAQYRYFPDLLVEYETGDKKLVEIKGSKYNIEKLFFNEEFRTKIKAGIDYANSRGFGFELWSYTLSGSKYIKKTFNEYTLCIMLNDRIL